MHRKGIEIGVDSDFTIFSAKNQGKFKNESLVGTAKQKMKIIILNWLLVKCVLSMIIKNIEKKINFKIFKVWIKKWILRLKIRGRNGPIISERRPRNTCCSPLSSSIFLKK